MKNWQYWIIVLIIIVGLGITIYQNNKIISYGKVLDYRSIDIYKHTSEIKDRSTAIQWMISNYTRLEYEE